MRRLLLLRHAKSSWSDPTARDHERPLNDRGRRAAPLVGDYLRREDLVPDLVLCSSARRTCETLARLDAPRHHRDRRRPRPLPRPSRDRRRPRPGRGRFDRHAHGRRPQPDDPRARTRPRRRWRPGRARRARTEVPDGSARRAHASRVLGRPRPTAARPSTGSSRPATWSNRGNRRPWGRRCGPCTRCRLGRDTSVPGLRLRPSFPTAHGVVRGELLPSGPDSVRRDPVAQDPILDTFARVVRDAVRASNGSSAPHTWIWGTGHHELPA